MPFEYGGQTWPDTPLVIRWRDVRLLHPTPESVDFYRCRWPDGQELTQFRETMAGGFGRSALTYQMPVDEHGVHNGKMQMHLTPGQPATGPVRCKAGTLGDQRDLAWNVTAYRMWKAEHPGEELQLTVLWSDWSNPLALGEVSPDPVPEPAFVLLLAVGLLGLCFAAWRRKKP